MPPNKETGKKKGKRVLTLCIRLLLSVQSTIRSHHGLRVPHRRVLQIRETTTVFAALSLAQRAGSRDLDRLVRRDSRVLKRGEEGLGGFGGEVLVVVVVDLDHGGVDTGTKTFDFDEGKQAVFGGVAGGDTQVFRNGFEDLGATAATELAWCLRPLAIDNDDKPRQSYSSAKLNKVFANGLAVVHGVESCDFVNTHRGHLKQPGDLVHDTDAGVAVLALTQIQDRHDSSLLVLGRVAFEDLIDELEVLVVEFEREGRVVGGLVAVLIEQITR